MDAFYEERILNGDIYVRTVEGGLFHKLHPEIARSTSAMQKYPRHQFEHFMVKVAHKLGLKSVNAAISAIGMQASAVSRIRQGRIGIVANNILAIYDLTGFSIEEIREGCGVTK